MNSTRMWRSSVFLVLMSWALALCASAARADAVALARADDLFARGKSHFARGDYDGACRDFAESVALDPATGSILALAMCHERDGKYATASRAYEEVLRRSESEGRADRAAAARDRLARLAPNLSTIKLVLAKGEVPAGFQLRIDTKSVSPEEWSKPIPVDGGSLHVEATAHGMQTFSADLTVLASEDHQVLTIPELTPVQIALPFIRPAVFFASAALPRTEPRQAWLNETRLFGIGTAGLGLIGLSAGAALSVHAANVERREARCDEGACEEQGPRIPSAARDARRASTLAFVTGGAALATGVALIVWGGRAPQEKPVRRVALSPTITSRDAGATLQLAF